MIPTINIENDRYSVLSSNLFPGRYKYGEDLRALDSCRAPIPTRIPKELGMINTPLKWQEWAHSLARHPDEVFRSYVIEGIRHGFRVGYDYTSSCRRATRNLPSSAGEQAVVREYLSEECAMGRVLGPFDPSSLPQVHISPIGVIPKSTPGKWRLIVNLSAPEPRSVNDGISKQLSSLSYISVRDAAKLIVAKGRGALLAKVDIKSTYRVVPIHPDDRWLLGMSWDQQLFVDTQLPFGLRSAPKIFTALADAAEWIVLQEGGGTVLHYLDDFLVIGAPASNECATQLATMLTTFDRLGLPVALEKLEGPTTRLTFLGIELDTSAMEMRLPREKLRDLKQLIRKWQGLTSGTRGDLESLAGSLQHACQVVPPGRTFLRRIFELMAVARNKYRPIRLNKSFRSDLQWWATFLETWNGVSLLRECGLRPADHHVYTDASGRFGCGALWQDLWFQYHWSAGYQDESITLKELLPVVLACAIWGPTWQDSSVLVHCDNEAAVQILNTGYSKDSELMHLLRCLFFIRAHFRVSLRAVHIPGVSNSLADAISRNNLPVLFSQVPSAARAQVAIPPALLAVLVEQRPDWTSVRWSQRFGSYFQQA